MALCPSANARNEASARRWAAERKNELDELCALRLDALHERYLASYEDKTR